MEEKTISHENSLILIVDDSEDMRFLLEQILEGAGYHVILAQDGYSSLAQAKLHRPDLILMDLSLPGMSGWEAVEQLRKMDAFRSTPIIAVTAHVTPYEEERAKAAGCSAHVGKPFTPHILLESIACLLSTNS